MRNKLKSRVFSFYGTLCSGPMRPRLFLYLTLIALGLAASMAGHFATASTSFHHVTGVNAENARTGGIHYEPHSPRASGGIVPCTIVLDGHALADFIERHAFGVAVAVVVGLLAVIVLLTFALVYRGRTRRAIERAKQEWERTFDAVPDLIAIIGPDYRILRLNVAMADRLGMRPHDAVGKYCHEAVHGTNGPIPACPHLLLMKDGQEHTEEIFEERLGGYFQISASPISTPAGEVLGCVHVARDITDARKARKRSKPVRRGTGPWWKTRQR